MPLTVVFESLLKLWSIVKNFRFFWKVLQNWDFIKQSHHDTILILKGMTENGGRLPHCDETKKMFSMLKEFFEREIIDVPGISEQDLASMFNEIQANIVCSIEDRKKLLERGQNNGK